MGQQCGRFLASSVGRTSQGQVEFAHGPFHLFDRHAVLFGDVLHALKLFHAHASARGAVMHGFAQFGIGMYRILDLGQAKTGR